MNRMRGETDTSRSRQSHRLAWFGIGTLVTVVFAVGIGFLFAYYYVFDFGFGGDELDVAMSDTMAKMKLRFGLGALIGVALGIRFMVKIYRSDYGS